MTFPIIGLVLAGGQSSRMGGGNKAELKFEGQTFIKLCVDKLSHQTCEVIISAPHNHDLNCQFVPDHTTAYKGPLAGIYAGLHWLKNNRPDMKAMVSVAVDTPFFPDDLVARFMAIDPSANRLLMAKTDDGIQPTFAIWPVALMDKMDAYLKNDPRPSLQGFAKENNALFVYFDNAHAFFNINTTQDFQSLL